VALSVKTLFAFFCKKTELLKIAAAHTRVVRRHISLLRFQMERLSNLDLQTLYLVLCSVGKSLETPQNSFNLYTWFFSSSARGHYRNNELDIRERTKNDGTGGRLMCVCVCVCGSERMREVLLKYKPFPESFFYVSASFCFVEWFGLLDVE
jgi:hypothetical protein